MATRVFRAKLTEEGLLPVPSETMRQLGLHAGDEVEVSLGMIAAEEEREQQELQAKFDRFFERLKGMTFEKPTPPPPSDRSEAAFQNAMDEKFQRLGFKP